MDPLRIERLVWAGVFAAVVALVVGFVLVPDPTSPLSVVVAVVAFAVVAPIAVRFSLDATSPDAEPGDQTAQYVTFFIVAITGSATLARLGYDGVVAGVLVFGSAWLVATQAKRLNPRRWNRPE